MVTGPVHFSGGGEKNVTGGFLAGGSISTDVVGGDTYCLLQPGWKSDQIFFRSSPSDGQSYFVNLKEVKKVSPDEVRYKKWMPIKMGFGSVLGKSAEMGGAMKRLDQTEALAHIEGLESAFFRISSVLCAHKDLNNNCPIGKPLVLPVRLEKV